MPRTNGIFTLVPSYKATSGQTIKTEQHNPPLEDIAQAMTESLPRDGSAPMTENLPMNGKKITGLAPGTDSSDAVRKDQTLAYNAWLSSVSGLTMSADKLAYATGVSTAALTSLTPFARTLLDDANAATARTTLGLGSAATKDIPNNSDLSVNGDDAARRDNVKSYVDNTVSDLVVPATVMQETRSSGVSATTLTPNTWTTIELNGFSRNAGNVTTLTLVDNQFEFSKPGFIEWCSPGRDSFQTRIYNVTDGAVLEYGSSALTAGGSTSVSVGFAAVTTGKKYRLEQNSSGSISGRPASRGVDEVYAQVKFTRSS